MAGKGERDPLCPVCSSLIMKVHIDFTGFCQKLLVDGRPFLAQIYEGEGDPPVGFNIVRLSLDASAHSSLDWKLQIERAQRYTANGFFILWELQFSLFNTPLEDDVHFLSLHISVQHFIDTIWPHFHQVTFGVALYRGRCALSQKQELLDDLKILSSSLPDETSCFIFLDTSSITEPESYFSLVSQEGYGHLKLILKGTYFERYPYAVPALAWGNSYSPLGYCSEKLERTLQGKKILYALCLPNKLEGELTLALEQGDMTFPFRVIPEALLDQEWDGVDQLMIFPQLVSEQGWRKIRGFVAAGGEIIDCPDGATLPRLPQTFPVLPPPFCAKMVEDLVG